jgi:hypothetical protein
MKKNKKGFVIIGLTALCAVLTVGVFMLGQSSKGVDVPIDTGGAYAGVTPGGIEAPEVTDIESLAVTEIPVIESNLPTVRPITDITPIERTTPAPGQSAAGGLQNDNDITLTAVTGRPEPPELPETAFVWEQDEEVTPEDVEAYEALDPALRNPDVRPDITPAPVQPTPTPQAPSGSESQSMPNAGDRRNGEMYIPGFGWIKDEGGGGRGTQSQLDPNHADFDKIIGY